MFLGLGSFLMAPFASIEQERIRRAQMEWLIEKNLYDAYLESLEGPALRSYSHWGMH